MDSFVNSDECNNLTNCIELTLNNNDPDYMNILSTSNNNFSPDQQSSFQTASNQTLSSMTNTSTTTAPPVISLLKLQSFLYQPKFKNIIGTNTGRNSEPGRN